MLKQIGKYSFLLMGVIFISTLTSGVYAHTAPLFDLSRKEDFDGRAHIRGVSPAVLKEQLAQYIQNPVFPNRVSEPTRQETNDVDLCNRQRRLYKANHSIEQVPPNWLCSLQWPKDSATEALVTLHPSVIWYIEHFQGKGKATLASWLKSKGKYEEMIASVLDEYQLPRFLIYVAMIESGFNEKDVSNKGAKGLWQFMPAAAKIYGLRKDSYVDEALDPEASTRAFARYISDLYARFGNWHLTLAAFNAGYGAMGRSITQFNTNDYWPLRDFENAMPYSTGQYVPKIIAAFMVGESKDYFGLGTIEPADSLVSGNHTEVLIKGKTSLLRIARYLGISVDVLEKLNPALIKKYTPPGEWLLKIPGSSLDQYVAFQPQIENEIEAPSGEDAALAQPLTIPSTKSLASLLNLASATTMLAKKNTPSANVSVVVVPVKTLQAQSLVTPIFYRVGAVESLGDIATRWNVNPQELLAMNPHITPSNFLQPGMVLVIWDKNVTLPENDRAGVLAPQRVHLVEINTPAFFDTWEATRNRRRLTIQSGSGDTIMKLAQRLSVLPESLSRINLRGLQEPLPDGTPIVYYKQVDEQEPIPSYCPWESREHPETVQPVQQLSQTEPNKAPENS